MTNKQNGIWYVDTRTNLGTYNRSYAIHLLKINTCLRGRHGFIDVYKNKIQTKENFIESWWYYIPRKNAFNLQGQYGSLPSVGICETNMIYGRIEKAPYDFCCMPATKEVKYLKNYKVVKNYES